MGEGTVVESREKGEAGGEDERGLFGLEFWDATVVYYQ